MINLIRNYICMMLLQIIVFIAPDDEHGTAYIKGAYYTARLLDKILS